MSAAGTTGTDWEWVRTHEPDLTDPDAPDLSDEFRAEILRRRGRPKGSGHKTATSLRIDTDVLAAWRATGPGWQTRMNEALRAALKKQPRKRRKPAATSAASSAARRRRAR